MTIVFLALFVGVAVYGYLMYKNSSFGKFDRFNVVLLTPKVALLSVDLSGKGASFLTFPDDLYVPELAFGYGPYKAAKVYEVGQLDKRGGQTVALTISDFVGVPVDGYIYGRGSFSGGVKSFFINPTNVLAAQSNLSVLDRIKLLISVMGLRFDKIKSVDLSKLAVPLVLSDGTTAQTVDKEVLDSNLRDFFMESRVRDENFRVEVVNSTPVLGLGNRASRIMTNIGASVVSVATLDQKLPSCEILAIAKAVNSITVRRLAKAFSCKVTETKEEGRAEVTVVLGEDYAKILGK